MSMSLPLLGLGTFQHKDPALLTQVLQDALDLQYPLIDTATIYKNESVIGNFLVEHKARERVFLTTKISPYELGSEEKVYQAAIDSLTRLQTNCVDLLLIHWPGKHGVKTNTPENEGHRLSAWRALEKLHAEGKAKSIGVSNFTVSHLRQLLPRCIVRPSVNQVELHPLCPQRELIAYCNGEKIHVQAYSSLGQETGKLVLMTHPIVVAIAERVRRTPAQVLLRYGVQQGISVIPKSSSRAHLAENASIFDFALTDDEMMSLHNMCDGKPQHFCWDPTNVL